MQAGRTYWLGDLLQIIQEILHRLALQQERGGACYFRIIQDVLGHFIPQQIWCRCINTFIRSQLWSGGAMRDPPFICNTQAHEHTGNLFVFSL